jgi:glycosyltransferase involved in cell wall biosynthesis
MARQFGVPTAIIGQGIGPLRKSEGRLIVRDIFSLADHVSVRDEASVDLLREMGVSRELIVAPDPVWATELAQFPLDTVPVLRTETSSDKLLALVIREWPHDDGWQSRLAAALERVAQSDWKLIWLPFQTGQGNADLASDVPVIRAVMARLPETLQGQIIAPDNIDHAVALIGACDAVVSMRLHGNILAMRASKPLVSFEYDPKMGAAAAMAGIPDSHRLALGDSIESMASALSRITDSEALWLPDQNQVARLGQDALAHANLLRLAMEEAGARVNSEWWQSGNFDWLRTWGILSPNETAMRDMNAELDMMKAQHEAYVTNKEIYIAQLRQSLEAAHLWQMHNLLLAYAQSVRQGARLFLRVAKADGIGAALNRSARVLFSRWLRPSSISAETASGSPSPYELISQIKPIPVEVIDRDYAANGDNRGFSCVTTVRNEAEGIELFLESIARQDVMPGELIIVDGGSSDDTVDRIRSFRNRLPCSLKLIEAGDVNIAKGRNVGIAVAQHEIIVLIDAGCRLNAGFFANITGPFADRPNLDLVAGIYHSIEATPHACRFIYHWSDMDQWDTFLPSARAVCIRKPIWEAAGGFPEYLSLTGEDTLFDVNYRRHSRRWLINRRASVTWNAPCSAQAAERLAYRYGQGDGESGFGDFLYYRALVDSLEGKAEAELSSVFRGYLDGRKQRAAIEVERRQIRGVVLMLSGVPFTDSGGGQRCSQLSMAFAALNYKVVFVNIYPSFEERKKLYFDTDLSLFEFYCIDDFSVADFVDRYRPYPDRPVIAIMEFPHPTLLPLVVALRAELGGQAHVVYDYLDNWRSSLGWKWYTESGEKSAIESADHLVASARTLQDDLVERSGRQVALIPNAVNDKLFDGARRYECPADMPTGCPVVIYIGALWGEWFDWDLLATAADRLPQVNFVLAGGVERDRASSFSRSHGNVHFLGLKPQTALPAYLAHSTLCIIPFKVDHITHYVNPLKVYEYLAMRRPVVVTAMAELRGLPGVTVANSPEEFAASIQSVIANPVLDAEEVSSFVSRNNWRSRVATIELLITRDPAIGEATQLATILPADGFASTGTTQTRTASASCASSVRLET